MKIIVGLGNPGKEYEKTRHNVGFMVLEELRKRLDFDEFKEDGKKQAEISSGEFNGEKVILARPLTFMNKSGEAVQKLVSFYKIDLADLLLIYDDIDLPLGTIRVREKGSAGTHNGMKSVISVLGSQDFPRFRIGIENRGELAAKEQDTTSFVLGKFSWKEKEIIKKSINKLVDVILGDMQKREKDEY